eukprot:200677_1
MDRKKTICDLYGIDAMKLDTKIANVQNIIEENDLSIILDCLCKADLDSSKAVEIYFDKSAVENDEKQSNNSEHKSNTISMSLMQQFQNKFSLNISNIINNNQISDEKKNEPLLHSDHSTHIQCTPLNNFTTIQSLLTNKNIIRGPAGHFSAKHDGPWNKFYIQLVENKNFIYESNINDIIVTIKCLMNDNNEYLCVRFNKKIGTTFKPNIIFAHWKLIEVNKQQHTIAFQSMSSPNMALCIDHNDDFKPSMHNFGDNIYPLHTNPMYQFKYIHQKPNMISSLIVNPAANRTALMFINRFAATMNRYSELGLPNMGGRTLTDQEKLHFIQHGYIVIRNAINKQLLDDAISWINTGLGQGSHINMKDINGAWIVKDPKILNLYFKSNLYSIARSILHSNPLDQNNYDSIIPAAQVALNFPLNDNIKRYWNKYQSIKANSWHIDGMNTKNDNTQVGGFSLLCGCVLSHWKEDYMGNFTVWDKSHYNLGNLIKNQGEHEFLMKEGSDENRSNLSNEVLQIKGNVGDVIICHPYLAHMRGPNFSNNIRYAVFIRPYVMNHASFYTELLEKNMFAEYKGLSHLIDDKPENKMNDNTVLKNEKCNVYSNDMSGDKSIFE